jgi:deoxyribose-phosphate aldolase
MDQVGNSTRGVDSAEKLAPLLDLAALASDLDQRTIKLLCQEAKFHHLRAVCVNGSRVVLTRHLLDDSPIKTCAVVGHPWGACDADAKRFEVEAAVDNGAQEIEAFINLGWLKDGNDELILRELRDLCEAADERSVKIIIDASRLTTPELALASCLVVDSGAHFITVASSVGRDFGPVMADQVRRVREFVGPEFGIKVLGSIVDTRQALDLLEAGGNLLGNGSVGEVLTHFRARQLQQPGGPNPQAN